ncbi:hypothetical protein SPONN_2283 [uncultured Candidatus Thioglobus sp.]|nr:hypothetical protein SPONN_2283 [uncultured Candidatus Thioglobus sp.]SMN00116.1 hypothetical protein SPONL_1086 [uncultured Candidatus Thioglobus sp.]
MKTILYIDGFNLYYGCLKNSSDKWLDLHKLFSGILNEHNPETEIIKIKFFTANIRANIATHKELAQKSQQDYHKALKQIHGDKIEIISNYFSLEKAVLPKYQKPIDKNCNVAVWKLEEKKTDVDLALSAYRDVSLNKAEQIVFVSNDSDIEPSLRYIKDDFPNKVIGVIIPKRKNSKRAMGNSLVQFSNWSRSYISDNELSNAPLPIKIPTNKKPIFKPDYW